MLVAVVLCCAALTLAEAPQQQKPPPAPESPVPPEAPPKPQFFAGTITELDEQHITVSRHLIGRSPEKRTFLLNEKTKMNRASMKVKTRVTVRYQHLPEGDTALEIHIQPSSHPAKPS
jgi:hypothetical protein